MILGFVRMPTRRAHDRAHSAGRNLCRRGGPMWRFMVAGGLVEVFLGIDAEGKSLEDIALPLSALENSSR